MKKGAYENSNFGFDDIQSVFSPQAKKESRKRGTRDVGLGDDVENIANVNLSAFSSNDDDVQVKKVKIDIQRKKVSIREPEIEKGADEGESEKRNESSTRKIKIDDPISQKDEARKKAECKEDRLKSNLDKHEINAAVSGSKYTIEQFFSKIRHNHYDVVADALNRREFDLTQRDDRGNQITINLSKFTCILKMRRIYANPVFSFIPHPCQ